MRADPLLSEAMWGQQLYGAPQIASPREARAGFRDPPVLGDHGKNNGGDLRFGEKGRLGNFEENVQLALERLQLFVQNDPAV